MGRRWVWFAGPAAATTGLFIAVAAFSEDGENRATLSPVVRTVMQGAPVTRTRAVPKRATTSAPTRTQVTTTTRETTTTSTTTTAATTTPAPPSTTRAPTTATTRARAAPTSKPTTRKGRPKLVRVPNLLGLAPPQAIAELAEAGFRGRVRRERSLQPDGLVFEQKPPPGKRVRRGWTVRLTVAFYTPPEPPPPPPAPPSSTMTRLVGLDYAEAASRMEELGIIANSYPVRSSRPVAVVVAQTPPPGTRVLRGSRIRLTVSAGERPLSPETVPDTVGLTELDGHVRCRDAHFMCRTVVVPGERPGRVVRQQPKAGRAKRPLTQMTLYVGG